jgi:hypothetical protein
MDINATDSIVGTQIEATRAEASIASLAIGNLANPLTSPLSLEQRAVVVSELKALAKEIDAAVEAHTIAFCAEAEGLAVDELPIVDGKRAIRVQVDRTTFPDGDGLLTYLVDQKVDQAVIDQFLTKDVKISNPALEKAIKDGLIDAELVKPFMVIKSNKPYVGWEKVETEA